MLSRSLPVYMDSAIYFSYTKTYSSFSYLLSKDADSQIDKFIKREKPLRDYIKEIEKQKKMAWEVGSLPIYVPMHLFMLDCSLINQVQLIQVSGRL